MATKNVQGAPEEVSAALSKSEAFFEKNKKAIIGAVIALVVIIVGIFVYTNYISAPRENKASTQLAKAQELFNNELFDKAAPEFQKVIDDFGGTDASNLANLYLGLCYANQDKWEDAVKFLDKYSPADDAMVSPSAVAALGNAYAHVGNIDKAVSSLKKAAKMADGKSINDANSSISATFLMQAAQLLESENKSDDALKLYQEIKTKYVNASQVQSKEVDKYIERLQEK